MPNIDETSHKLGSLDGKIDAIIDSLKTLSAKTGEIYDKQVIMNGSVSKAHWRLDMVEDQLEKVAEIANDLNESKKKMWWTLIGLGAGAGAGGGFAGSKIGSIIGALFY